MDASFRLLFFVCFILLTIKMKITCHPQKHYLQNENSLRANAFIFAIQNNMWQSRDKYSRNKCINPMWFFFYFYLQALSFIYWILIITIIYIVLYDTNKRVRKRSHWRRWEIHFNLYQVLNQTVIIYTLKIFTVMSLCAIVQKICMLYLGCTIVVK